MSKVIVFHGADHKVGTSQIAESCAEFIASVCSEDILLINADGDFGIDYYTYPPGIIEIIPSVLLDSDVIKNIKTKAKRQNNYYTLNLSNDLTILKSFSPELAEDFISQLKKHFGLIIIDTGCSFYNEISLGSLFSADYIYCLLNQTESSLRRLESSLVLYKKLQITFNRFLINRYLKTSIYDKQYIEERLFLEPSSVSIIHEDKNGSEAESETLPLIHCRPSRRYVKEIQAISEEILNYAGIQIGRVHP